MGSVQRCPIPRQQLIQPVDLVVMDAVENVSKIGLRVETVAIEWSSWIHFSVEERWNSLPMLLLQELLMNPKPHSQKELVRQHSSHMAIT